MNLKPKLLMGSLNRRQLSRFASEAKQSLRLLRLLTRPRSDSEGYFALAIMSAAILCRVKHARININFTH
ncbi:hypothetical protein Thein_0237 [Thermodesulfatator indicus DSM 15286]|uniref:Uncharacterized protein n=1 Tax=Thermodesulfatator indicus (strain DSM 15286 / JCM 11887 / CIR29812) TaxID=667014 RepID=F8AE49_THEID|nr:hypothetical protein Thein_0237 [Thermodesulfatator indicus DSM 15286]